MRVGLQTISWGVRIYDMEALASSVRQLEYEGLEFAQGVDILGPVERLQDTLKQNDLSLIGLAGGSLKSRIEYAEGLEMGYLYIDEWDEDSIIEAIAKGISVGIHPHFYKTIETIRDAKPYLERFPELGLILDTAHLYLAEDNILDGIKEYKERILAIHLKDWTSRFGRSPYRFARGFTALGTGELENILKSTVDYLIQTDYKGWIVVEQDTPFGNPIDCARISREWLRSQGI